MLSFVLATSVLNIMLGAGLALLVMSRAKSELQGADEEETPAPVAAPTVVQEETVAPPPAPSPQPVKFVMEDLSPAWVEKLASESMQAKSMVEASTLVLKLEVGRYRENLVALEEQIRQMEASDFANKLRGPIAEIVKLNEEWLKIQSEAVNMLSGKSARLDNFREISDRLEEVLLGQTSQIESTANNLLQLRTSDPPEALRIEIIRELQHLIELAHLLRDAIHSTLLAIFVADHRVERAEKKLATDSQTQLLSPIGLEGVFEHWKMADPTRQKPACVGLLGLDQFKRLNEVHGTRWADAILASASQLCAETIRKDRGFDRIARLTGDTLAIFYGDTSIRSCVTAMERLRQTLQQSTFVIPGQEITLTGSCAIAAQIRSESPTQTLERAIAALRVAKAKARDRIVINEGNLPEIVESPPISVRPVRVEIPTAEPKPPA